MLSVIIPTRDSERALVHTLAALVPGATAGVVREVIVADGGSQDETEQVADIAGCVFLSSGQSLGARLKAAAERSRGEWLLFLRPSLVPGSAWIEETAAFVRGHGQAAVFSLPPAGLRGWIRHLLASLPGNDQGLMIRKTLYAELGGHRGDVVDPERDLLRRIGRSRLTVLRTTVNQSNI
jgi:glycosyltransferase involved in cell wall biosynthesis